MIPELPYPGVLSIESGFSGNAADD